MPIAVPSTPSPPPVVRIAIIGAGPAGLGAAIALSHLAHPTSVAFEVTVYEQARELKEIGAGLSLHENAFRVLSVLGAREATVGFDKKGTQHVNGLTGELVSTAPPSTLPVDLQPTRVLRTRLQQALVARVPKGIVRLQKRLVGLVDLDEEGGVELTFEDGEKVEADIVIGAEGIRSVVRQHAFPDHRTKYTGTTIWRVLLPNSALAEIPSLFRGLEGPTTAWHHHPLGTGHFYLSGVSTPEEEARGEGQWEIAARAVEDPTKVTKEKVSWGVPATDAWVEAHFQDYSEPVRQALKLVPEGSWREFSAFAGPHLDRLHAWNGKLVLLGDASHPLTGAFGSGAAFALEDGYILAQSLAHAFEDEKYKDAPVLKSAELFDSIRSPYYKRMYDHLDAQKRRVAPPSDRTLTDQERLEKKVAAGFGGAEGSLDWIYHHDVKKTWADAVK